MKIKKTRAIPVMLGILALASCVSSPPPETAAAEPTAPAAPDVSAMVRSGDVAGVRDLGKGLSLINTPDSSGSYPLHIAADQTSPEMATLLLDQGAEPNPVDASGRTPLRRALEVGNIQTAALLADRGGDIFLADSSGVSPLDDALAKGPDSLKSIVGTRNVNTAGADGRTPLHVASDRLLLPAVAYLLSLSPDLALRDGAGRTALDCALLHPGRKESAQVAQALVLKGATPGFGDFDWFILAARSGDWSRPRFSGGDTVLHKAVRGGLKGFVEYFLDEKVPVDLKNAAGSTSLHEAVRAGDYEIAELLLMRGANPNARDGNGNTALHIALPETGRREGVKLLLGYKADPSLKDRSGNTPLHVAVLLGYPTETVPLFLDSGAFVDSANAEGDTPLALAVRKLRPDWSRLLVERGANVFARNSTGETPLAAALRIGPEAVDPLLTPATIRARDDSGNGLLHSAVLQRTIPETVSLMLERGVDLSSRNNEGDTPLHLAVRTDQADPAKVLLAAKADIFASNVKGATPLGLALNPAGQPKKWFFTADVLDSRDGAGNTPLHFAAGEGLTRAVSFLISIGAAPDARNADGQTPLHAAVRKDAPDCVRALLSSGSDILARDLTGATPLHSAVYWSARRSMEALVLAGADPNARDFAGASPLFEAVRKQDTAAAKWLLDKGADPGARNDAGRTPLQDAAATGDMAMVQLLLAAGANPNTRGDGGATSLHEAVASGNASVIPPLIARGADIHARNFTGETPLTLALSRSSEILKALLTKDSARSVDSDGRSVLRVILEAKPSPEFVDIALVAGARTEDRDRMGQTALHVAVSRKYAEITRRLVKGGADIFARDREGNTPISLALALGRDDLEALVDAANVNAKDVLGNRPLHYAALAGNAPAAEYLIALGADRAARNSAGETAADVASKRGHAELAGKLQ